METRSAVVAGTRLVLAMIEKQSPTPFLTEGWRAASDDEIDWPNHFLPQALMAFSHPAADVVRRVRRIAAELSAVGNLPPNLDFDFLYVER